MRTGSPFIVAGAGILLLAGAALTLFLGAAPTGPDDPLRLFGLWRLRHVVPFLVLATAGAMLVLYALSRSATVYAGIIIATVSVMVLTLEGAGRAGLVDWGRLLTPQPGDLDDLATKAIPYRSAEGVTYQDTAFLMGLDSTPMPFAFRADRHGFRNAEDRATADIILLGDSMLVGALVAADRIASTRLDALLPDTVMQVALIGIGVQEQHDLLRQTGIDLAGRTVVQFVFEGNDLLDSRSYRNPPAAEPASDRSLLMGLWNLATRATGRSGNPESLDVCRIDDQLYTFLWTDRAFRGHEDEIPHVTDALASFAADLRQSGGRLHVVYVPTKFRVLGEQCNFPADSRLRNVADHLSPLRAALRDWAAQEDVALLDLTDPLQTAARAGDIPWFWGDTHWNAMGHEVTANALARWLAGINR
jgi:hypothetical protein